MRSTARSKARNLTAQNVKLRSNIIAVVIQIGLIDIVFSLDSVFTAVGLAEHVEIMVAAIVVAVFFMMFLARPINEFIDRHPTIKMLALSFLILIGLALVGESLDFQFRGATLLRDGFLGRGRDDQHPLAQARAAGRPARSRVPARETRQALSFRRLGRAGRVGSLVPPELTRSLATRPSRPDAGTTACACIVHGQAPGGSPSERMSDF